MIYPVQNFKTEWNGTAGYGFNAKTSYGFHDGVDLNDNQGGNSDLGKPLYAISAGIISTIHKHTTGFGNHFLLRIEGKWGTRWIHYAHCKDIFVVDGQFVPEGFKIATVGNSGTTYAHCHFACIKKLTNSDNVANTQAELNDLWEDPIKFIETNMKPVEGGNMDQQKGSGKFDQVVRLLHENKLIDYDNPQRYYENDDVINAIKRLKENQGSPDTAKLTQAKSLADQITKL